MSNIRSFLVSALSLWLILPALAVDAVWFNPYDMPEHTNAKYLDKEYSLGPVFTRYYDHLEIPSGSVLKGSLAWKVDPSSGRLFPWYYDGDAIDAQTACSIYDAAALSGPVTISPKEQEWFNQHGFTANFHFDIVLRLKAGCEGAKVIKSVRASLSKEMQDVVLIRAIPKQVLNIYPGLFTAEELDAPSNFRILDKNWVKLHSVTSLREDWISHFADKSFKPTKKDILYIRDQQDRRGKRS